MRENKMKKMKENERKKDNGEEEDQQEVGRNCEFVDYESRTRF